MALEKTLAPRHRILRNSPWSVGGMERISSCVIEQLAMEVMAHLKMICLFTMICPWKNNIFWVLQALLDYQRINNQWAPMQPMHNARQIALSTASAPHLPVVVLVAALVFITWWWDNGAEIVEYPRAGVPIRWKNRKVTNRHPKISLIWHKYAKIWLNYKEHTKLSGNWEWASSLCFFI